MSRFSTSIIVHKPLERIFHLVLCERTMPLWISGFQKIELLHGKPGKAQSKYILTIEDRGKLVEVKHDLVEIRKFELIRLRMEHPDVITYSDIVFESMGNKTKIECHVQVEGKGFAVKMAIGIVKGILQIRQEKDYRAFKRVIEQSKG